MGGGGEYGEVCEGGSNEDFGCKEVGGVFEGGGGRVRQVVVEMETGRVVEEELRGWGGL